MLFAEFRFVAAWPLAHTMLGLANVLLATAGTVEAVNDASALAVEGGVYRVHSMVVMRGDMRELSENRANEASMVTACTVL